MKVKVNMSLKSSMELFLDLVGVDGILEDNILRIEKDDVSYTIDMNNNKIIKENEDGIFTISSDWKASYYLKETKSLVDLPVEKMQFIRKDTGIYVLYKLVSTLKVCEFEVEYFS